LTQADVLNPSKLCVALKAGNSPSGDLLRAKLGPEVTRRLDQSQSGQPVPEETLSLLVADLNRAIQSDLLYNASAFQSVKLKKSTKNLITIVQKKSEPASVAFLNRQLIEQVFPGTIRELQMTIDKTRSRGTLLQDVGSLLGMFSFTLAAAHFSRRAAFLGAFAFCLVAVAYTFSSLHTESDVYWMLPLMGFATLSVFAGYSIYFPELFPTRLRGTGVGLCYNTVRYLAAPFPFLLGWLSGFLPFRTVAVMMCGIYFVGIVALIWAPETKGKPLPEG